MEDKMYIRINGISKEHFERSDEILKKLHRKMDSCKHMMLIAEKLHMYGLAERMRQKGIDYGIAGLNLCNANIDLLMTVAKDSLFKK